MRELFLNVAKQLTLVMWIDDLQWGDLDSATMLQDWLQRPADAPILILLSYRSEEVTTSSCLQQLVGPAAQSPHFELSLRPLRDSDIERLCAQRLGPRDAASTKITERIVAEAKGDPFLALQLLLNRHILRDEPGDPERTLRRCLRFLASSAPEPLRKPAVARMRARIAYLRGDHARASELFQESVALHQKISAEDEVARERYALACLTPGAQGDEQKRLARDALSNCGVVDPEADLRVYYPELFKR